MNLLVTVLFGVLWLVLAFFALRWAAVRYFHEPGRALAAVITVLAAFLIGVAWPYSSLRGIRQTVADPGISGPAVPAPVRDVAAVCKSASVSSAAGRGSIDAVGDLRGGTPEARQDDFVADPSGTLSVVGWAASAADLKPATAVCLAIDGKIEPLATGSYGIGRADVGAAYKSDAMIPTGFTLALPIDRLPTGRHKVSVIVVAPSGSGQLQSKSTFRVP